MTDNEINRLVAERVYGRIVTDDNGLGDLWSWSPANTDGMSDGYPLPDYCNDPAAWGALFEHLTRAGRMPSLEGYSNFGYTAEVCPEGSDHGTPMNDALSGRALALAALRAHGVTP